MGKQALKFREAKRQCSSSTVNHFDVGKLLYTVHPNRRGKQMCLVFQKRKDTHVPGGISLFACVRQPASNSKPAQYHLQLLLSALLHPQRHKYPHKYDPWDSAFQNSHFLITFLFQKRNLQKATCKNKRRPTRLTTAQKGISEVGSTAACTN